MSAFLKPTASARIAPRHGYWLLACMAVLVLRGGVIWAARGDLTDDRDAYLAVARSVAAGDGYMHPATGTATAYRPPLFPLLVAAFSAIAGQRSTVAVVHTVAGVVTVLLTVRLGHLLGLKGGAWIAGAATAVDPLLLRYSTLPMTETVFTLLVTWMTVRLVAGSVERAEAERAEADQPDADRRRQRRLDAGTGIVFGLAALCRPTIWVFAAVAGVTLVVRRPRSWWRRIAWTAVAASVVVVAPWGIRNAFVLGHPVMTTTHGGYTLLLGNNPVFYREVVDRGWDSVWPGKSLAEWQQSLERAMNRETPPVSGEVARDRWMYRQAAENIKRQPVHFIRACWVRFLRFWSVVPLRAPGQDVSPTVRRATGCFYTALLAGMALGLLRIAVDLVRLRTGCAFRSKTGCAFRSRTGCAEKDVPDPIQGVGANRLWRHWQPLVLLIASFCCLHLLYWTNMRMRAPLVPEIAAISVFGWSGVLRALRLR